MVIQPKILTLTSNSVFVLNVLRVIAAQGVVFGHAISFFNIFASIQPPRGIYIQNISVVIFFLLSGFLITKSLVNAYLNDSFLEYFSNRFIRIYVTLIPCLFFITLIDFLSINISSDTYLYANSFNIKTFFGNIFMLQDFPINLSITSYGSCRPLWTLAIEFWLYISAGFMFLYVKKYTYFSWKMKIIALFSFIVPFNNLCAGRGNCLTLFWLLGGGGTLYYLFSQRFLI
jgi:peptidoglycan/LPS O-acetylase OafA/YrhL